ncbi:MAG: protein-L-isoaspartate(D-aspartate) O-methyltransferase, partial [Sedimentisphaerales bacterium]|nr:protein-L-isoaspartate(D-aspartate) O-methyltransferase [Sedimentisphaerales bacterium]
LPRHHFIPPENRREAYLDQPVAIGCGQTISQPYIVALMTEKLDLQVHQRVLEIGTGCGYQTAILAALVHKVYTIERIEELARQARANLEALAIDNVEYFVGDGAAGWPKPLAGTEPPDPEAPPRFDRILVAAGALEVPSALTDQLAPNGKMIIPIGPAGSQELILLENQAGRCRRRHLCLCRFVPLVSD